MWRADADGNERRALVWFRLSSRDWVYVLADGSSGAIDYEPDVIDRPKEWEHTE